MTSKQLLRIIPIVVAMCLGGYGAGVIAAGATTQSDQQKVDCKKYPEHQDCKTKAN
jgi:hypothetical protein